MARQVKSPTFSRSWSSEWGLTWVGRTNAMPGSSPVALLVFRAGTAPARIVAADPLAARGEPWLRAARADGRAATLAGDGLIAERRPHRPGGRGRWRTAAPDGRATHRGRCRDLRIRAAAAGRAGRAGRADRPAIAGAGPVARAQGRRSAGE